MNQIRKNQQIAFKEAQKGVKKYEKLLIKVYKSSLKQIRSDLMKLNEKIKWSFSELNKFNRLQKLEKEIVTVMRNINASSIRGLRQLNTKIVNNTYNRSWFGYEKEIKATLRFNKINPDLVKGIVTDPYPGVKLNDLMTGNSRRQIQRIKMEIGQGLALGEGANKISKRISKALNIGAVESMRIAKTEALRASSKAQLEATQRSEAMGIKITKIWLPDPRPNFKTVGGKYIRGSRADHKERMASYRAIFGDNKDMFKLGDGTLTIAPRMTGQAKHDINCICSYTEEIEDLPEKIVGKGTPASESIFDSISYNEWLKQKG